MNAINEKIITFVKTAEHFGLDMISSYSKNRHSRERAPSHLLQVPVRLRQMPVRQVLRGRLLSTPPFPFRQVCSMEPSLSICLRMKPEWQCEAHQHAASPVDRTSAGRLQECISRTQEGNSICRDYNQRWNVPTGESLAKRECNGSATGLMGYVDEIRPLSLLFR